MNEENNTTNHIITEGPMAGTYCSYCGNPIKLTPIEVSPPSDENIKYETVCNCMLAKEEIKLKNNIKDAKLNLQNFYTSNKHQVDEVVIQTYIEHHKACIKELESQQLLNQLAETESQNKGKR